MARKKGIRPTTPNVLAVYAMATEAEREHGRTWYANALAAATTLDPAQPERAAGVIAALSPRMPWARNLSLAAQAYADGVATGGLTANLRKANRILVDGEDPSVALIPASPTAQKVPNFYRCIIGDPFAVCIDRHAFDIAVGRVTDDATRAALGRKGVYEAHAAAYRRAARILGIPASEVQATTWVAWRRLKGIVD